MSKSKQIIQMIQAIDAGDIPADLFDACSAIAGDEFPFHYACGIVQVPDDGNKFAEWLKQNGYKFPEGQDWGWLGVWGT